MSAERSVAVLEGPEGSPLTIPVAIPEGRYRPSLNIPGPEDVVRMQAYGEMIAASKLFPKVGSWQAAIVIIQYGDQLGIGPFSALKDIDWIDGKPVCNAGLMNSLIVRDHGGEALIPLEFSPARVAIRYKRREWAEAREQALDIADIPQVLKKKDNWVNYPGDMLWARLVSRIARQSFADTIKGLYTREEIEDARAIETPGRVVERVPVKREPRPTPTTGATDADVAQARRDAEAAGLRKSVRVAFGLDPAAKAEVGTIAQELLRRRWWVEDTTGLTAEQVAEVRKCLDRPGLDAWKLRGQVAIVAEEATTLDGVIALEGIYAAEGIDDPFLLGALATRKERLEAELAAS